MGYRAKVTSMFILGSKLKHMRVLFRIRVHAHMYYSLLFVLMCRHSISASQLRGRSTYGIKMQTIDPWKIVSMPATSLESYAKWGRFLPVQPTQKLKNLCLQIFWHWGLRAVCLNRLCGAGREYGQLLEFVLIYGKSIFNDTKMIIWRGKNVRYLCSALCYWMNLIAVSSQMLRN